MLLSQPTVDPFRQLHADFSVESFELRLGAGAGSAYVYNMTANRLSVQTHRWVVSAAQWQWGIEMGRRQLEWGDPGCAAGRQGLSARAREDRLYPQGVPILPLTPALPDVPHSSSTRCCSHCMQLW